MPPDCRPHRIFQQEGKLHRGWFYSCRKGALWSLCRLLFLDFSFFVPLYQSFICATSHKNGYKNTPMQVPRKCDIILLLRDYYIVSSTLYSIFDSASVVSRGGFFFVVIPQAGRRIQHLRYLSERVGSISAPCGYFIQLLSVGQLLSRQTLLPDMIIP